MKKFLYFIIMMIFALQMSFCVTEEVREEDLDEELEEELRAEAEPIREIKDSRPDIKKNNPQVKKK